MPVWLQSQPEAWVEEGLLGGHCLLFGSFGPQQPVLVQPFPVALPEISPRQPGQGGGHVILPHEGQELILTLLFSLPQQPRTVNFAGSN